MKLILTFIAILITSVILVLMLFIPDKNIAHIGDFLLEFPGIDKIIHFVEHFAITSVIFFVLKLAKSRVNFFIRLFVAASGSTVFSIVDEFHQINIAGRSFELTDLVANSLGALFGVVVLSCRRINSFACSGYILILLIAIVGVTHDSYSKQKPYYLGMQLEDEKKFQLAREQYIKALQVGNDNGNIYNNIAWIDLVYLGRDPHEAIIYAKKAVEKDDDNADYLDTYGWALFRVKRYDEALTYLKRAFSLNSGIYCIHYHLGLVYSTLGKFEKARYHLEEQVNLNPEDKYGLLAQSALMKKGYEEPESH